MRSCLSPEKVSDLVMLRLNADVVKQMKGIKEIEKKFTKDEVNNLINVDLRPRSRDRDDDGESDQDEEFIETIVDQAQAPDDVIMVDVQDTIARGEGGQHGADSTPDRREPD